MSTYESYAEYYHDLTKYTPEGIASSKHILDFGNQPVPYKEYPNKKTIDLSYLLPLDRNPFSDVGIKNPTDFTKEEKELALISKLLYFTNGITAMIPYEDKPFYMRSSPSAGGLYPTEIYLISSGHEGLDDGIYNFNVLKQVLVKLFDGNVKEKLSKALFDNPDLESGSLFLVLTGVFYRSSWRYQDRAYRRICLDTGHVIGNIDLVSDHLGLKALLFGGFKDKEVNEILSLDEDEEQALAVIALVNKDKKVNEKSEKSRTIPSRLDNKNIKTPEGIRLIQLHNRSSIEENVKVPDIKIENIEEKIKFSSSISFEKTKENFNWQNNLFNTIVKRRSTRSYSSDPISKEELGLMLDFAYHPGPDYFDLSLLQTFVAVNNVTGLEEGCYFYSKDGRHLRQLRFKNLRDEVYYLCLGQELGYKASAVVFHTADLSRAVFKYGERAYRYLHLDAGHIGQRLNLAAINMDLGVSGIGGFFDDKVNELLGIPEHEAVVYITTLGVPVKHVA